MSKGLVAIIIVAMVLAASLYLQKMEDKRKEQAIQAIENGADPDAIERIMQSGELFK